MTLRSSSRMASLTKRFRVTGVPLPSADRTALFFFSSVLLINRSLGSDENVPRNAVRQFSQVPRPIQILEVFEHFRRERLRLRSKLLFKMDPEELSQRRNVFASLAQRRHFEAKPM